MISSTGVYGGLDGTIDEDSACQPLRASAEASLQAEEWLRGQPDIQSCAFRLAGIYGPGRIPNAERIRRGEPLDTDPAHCLNMIHADDAARVITQSFAEFPMPAVLNVSDGTPVTRGDFYQELARLGGWDPPRFGTFSAANSAQRQVTSRYRETLLEPHLRFPSYREGLADALAANGEGTGS